MVNKPFVRYVVTKENIGSSQMAGERTVRDTDMFIRIVLKIPRNNAGIVEDRNKLAQNLK